MAFYIKEGGRTLSFEAVELPHEHAMGLAHHTVFDLTDPGLPLYETCRPMGVQAVVTGWQPLLDDVDSGTDDLLSIATQDRQVLRESQGPLLPRILKDDPVPDDRRFRHQTQGECRSCSDPRVYPSSRRMT